MRSIGRVVATVFLVFLSATVVRAQAPGAAGRVTITYTLTRMSRIASNQYAIWIEDEKGEFLRTLFVTDFTGRRAGWKRRPQVIPTWIRAADVKNAPQSDVDAVSGATPGNGTLAVTWDLKDRSGQAVAPGTYRYLIEGNISWENTVLWTGTIRVGGGCESSQASAAYTPEGAETLGSPITGVSAVYEPAK